MRQQHPHPGHRDDSRGSSDSPAGQRRALTNVGGAVLTVGTPASSAPLVEALRDLELEPIDRLTHGFHTYPARLHPALPHRLLERYAARGDTVLDPFCGGGTTVVEALVHGCQAIGTDINPVALRIARIRTLRWPAKRIDAFVTRMGALSDAAFGDARKRVSRPLGEIARRQREWYAPHVLQELQGLYERILEVESPGEREVALMVFSSILVKVSQQVSDTRQAKSDRQVGRGTTSRLFGRKAAELGGQLAALAALVPSGTPEPILRQADARELPGERETVDLVITSPPYVGTYDYASHQDRRFDWLEVDATFAKTHEIGARRDADDPRRAWIEDDLRVLRELARVLKPGGRVFIVAGDGVLAGEPWFVDQEIRRAAEAVDLRVLAIASQERPHFNARAERAFGGRPRREHLISLRKGGSA